MALKKEMNLPNGVQGNYWKIVEESCNHQTGKCSFVLALFKTSEYSEKSDLGLRKVYSFKLTKDEMLSDRVKLGYEKIKKEVERGTVNPFNQKVIKDQDLQNVEDC